MVTIAFGFYSCFSSSQVEYYTNYYTIDTIWQQSKLDNYGDSFVSFFLKLYLKQPFLLTFLENPTLQYTQVCHSFTNLAQIPMLQLQPVKYILKVEAHGPNIRLVDKRGCEDQDRYVFLEIS